MLHHGKGLWKAALHWFVRNAFPILVGALFKGRGLSGIALIETPWLGARKIFLLDPSPRVIVRELIPCVPQLLCAFVMRIPQMKRRSNWGFRLYRLKGKLQAAMCRVGLWRPAHMHCRVCEVDTCFWQADELDGLCCCDGSLERRVIGKTHIF